MQIWKWTRFLIQVSNFVLFFHWNGIALVRYWYRPRSAILVQSTILILTNLVPYGMYLNWDNYHPFFHFLLWYHPNWYGMVLFFFSAGIGQFCLVRIGTSWFDSYTKPNLSIVWYNMIGMGQFGRPRYQLDVPKLTLPQNWKTIGGMVCTGIHQHASIQTGTSDTILV